MGDDGRPIAPQRTFAELTPSLRKGDYDFFDFGAGRGTSLGYYGRRFGGRGLGIEIDATKVDEARAHGRNVVEGSLFEVPARKLVQYVTMDNVLEHMTSLEEAVAALGRAVAVARDFVYIRHPSFEDEHYLRSLGVSATWVHRTAHRAHVRLVDFAVMVDRLGIRSWEVHPVGLVPDSSHDQIVPRGTPKNELTYDPDQHGSRPEITFDRPVFQALDLLFHLTPVPRAGLVYDRDPAGGLARPRLVHVAAPTRLRRPLLTRGQLRREVGRRLPTPVKHAAKAAAAKARRALP
jgi:hypothetical protein